VRIDGNKLHNAVRLAGFVLLAVALTGCGSGEPSGNAATTAQTAPPAEPSSSLGTVRAQGGSAAAGAESDLAWTSPAGWQSVPPSSSMRKAQYVIPKSSGDAEDGECAVFYFGPGQGGDAQANADRWASQFSSPDGSAPVPTISEETVGDSKVMKVLVEGTYQNSAMMGGGDTSPKPGYMLLGAIVEGPDANWFFKCTGPAATMKDNRGEFDAMIASVKSS